MLEQARQMKQDVTGRIEVEGKVDTVLHDPRRRRPDIGVARELLGWEPRVALEEGLARTIAWWRDGDAGRDRPSRVVGDAAGLG